MRGIVLGVCLTGFVSLASSVAAQPQAVNADLLQLHDDLRLTPEQQGAWKTYTTAIAPSREAADRHRATQDMLPLIQTPRRIALIEATMTADIADFHRQGEAVVAFYDQLTPAQQRTFDLESVPKPDDRAGPGASARPPLG